MNIRNKLKQNLMKINLISGNLTASQQKVSLAGSAETFNKTGERSHPMDSILGFTPKYLPSPQPISINNQ